MLYTLYAVWDLDCDAPGIIGLFETKEEADAHAAYTAHEYCRAMTVVEYQAKQMNHNPGISDNVELLPDVDVEVTTDAY